MPPPSKVFPLDPTKPLIPVDVLLEGPQGQQLIRMALDTGATYTIAPRWVLQAIGYQPSATGQSIEFIAAGSVERKPLVTVHGVCAFGVRVAKSPVVCHDLPAQSPVRGLLGLNFLRHFNVHLNFLSRRLVLSPR
ncbi:MAG: hypothetical protein A3B73_05560 [Omnitrophica WOR_2 bacterium RIFCSPHIGHO2_02_FULL_63_39]|nr:MAG: hypothetical protein A3B73_05560 [Omnitrophica WOR_2 bacterium RIFCSPHIGHO2_02_FULL_63_39]OGX47225.1 MAG: hypothetical protein A3G88_07400 [Omnitrophica WOR_2 bacterium RIFCSPLOWO2_12_FULL_63_16]